MDMPKLEKMASLAKKAARDLATGALGVAVMIVFSGDIAKRAWAARKGQRGLDKAWRMMSEFNTVDGAQKMVALLDKQSAMAPDPHRPTSAWLHNECPAWRSMGLALGLSIQSPEAPGCIARAMRSECSAGALAARLMALEYGMERLSTFHLGALMARKSGEPPTDVPEPYAAAGHGSCVAQADKLGASVAPAWLDAWGDAMEQASVEGRVELSSLAAKWARMLQALPVEGGEERLKSALRAASASGLSWMSRVAMENGQDRALASHAGFIDALAVSKQMGAEISGARRASPGANRI